MPTTIRTLTFTALAMLAFAGNSLLCRLALKHAEIDPASFTTLRIFSGALVLWLLLRQQNGKPAGNWPSAIYLFIYAAAFSFAYTHLEAGTGALLLFGAVQVTMISLGLLRGERLNRWATAGLLLALGGLVVLLLPGATAPSLTGALLMLASGVAWGLYSLKGRGVTSPLAATAGNSCWRLFRRCSSAWPRLPIAIRISWECSTPYSRVPLPREWDMRSGIPPCEGWAHCKPLRYSSAYRY